MTPSRLPLSPKASRQAFSAALVLIGGLALYTWTLSPHLGYLHAMQRLEPVVQRVVEEKDRIRDTLDAKRGQWRALQQEWADLREGVFTARDAQACVRNLLAVVEQAGCVVRLADFAGEGRTERVEEPNEPVVVEARHLNLVAVGRPEQISALLQQLGDHRPRIWIDSCQCDFPSGGTGPAQCSLALTLYSVGTREEISRR